MLCLMQSNSSTKRGQGRDQAQNEEGQCCRYIIIACTMYVGMCVHVCRYVCACVYVLLSDTVADWQSKQNMHLHFPVFQSLQIMYLVSNYLITLFFPP